ncbi:MAG: TolC family outer membrane protein [Alphaproteobacteria bacterium]|nr:TolC family outer membrane protein [Alphaproteobacteria bacterium]
MWGKAMMGRRSNFFPLAAIIAVAMVGTPASAETLMEALALAYKDNPSITAARADQRAVDESVAIQRSSGLPFADSSISYSNNIYRQFPQISAGEALSMNAQVVLPLYNGGSVRNAVNAAKLRVESGQFSLRSVEANLFQSIVATYMNVLRDSAIVELNRQNVRALDINLSAGQERFEVGDLTRTDVAQSRSRLALARSSLQSAQAQLIASKENYIALVGKPPQNLEVPPALPGLPESAEAAVALALANNPALLAANKARDATRYDVKSANGQIMPRVSAFINGSQTDYLGSTVVNQGGIVNVRNDKAASAGATISIPLYQGGRPGAQQRQAVARESSAIEQATATERAVIAQTRASYALWRAALETITSAEEAVKSAELALDGVKVENSAGSRTILDILNAEQELLNTQVQLVSARRDAYVSAFTLLANMGRAEARDLDIDRPYYDPKDNYARSTGKFLDFDFARQPKPISSSTADTPPQQPATILIPGFSGF